MEWVALEPLCGRLGFSAGELRSFWAVDYLSNPESSITLWYVQNAWQWHAFHNYPMFTDIIVAYKKRLSTVHWCSQFEIMLVSCRLVSIPINLYPLISRTCEILFGTHCPVWIGWTFSRCFSMARLFVWVTGIGETNTILIRILLDSLAINSGWKSELIESVCFQHISEKDGCKLRAWFVWIGTILVSFFSFLKSQPGRFPVGPRSWLS